MSWRACSRFLGSFKNPAALARSSHSSALWADDRARLPLGGIEPLIALGGSRRQAEDARVIVKIGAGERARVGLCSRDCESFVDSASVIPRSNELENSQEAIADLIGGIIVELEHLVPVGDRFAVPEEGPEQIGARPVEIQSVVAQCGLAGLAPEWVIEQCQAALEILKCLLGSALPAGKIAEIVQHRAIRCHPAAAVVLPDDVLENLGRLGVGLFRTGRFGHDIQQAEIIEVFGQHCTSRQVAGLLDKAPG